VLTGGLLIPRGIDFSTITPPSPSPSRPPKEPRPLLLASVVTYTVVPPWLFLAIPPSALPRCVKLGAFFFRQEPRKNFCPIIVAWSSGGSVKGIGWKPIPSSPPLPHQGKLEFHYVPLGRSWAHFGFPRAPAILRPKLACPTSEVPKKNFLK